MKEKIQNLRKQFVDNDIDGYIVPSTDEYQGEYTHEYAKRLRFISGFTGSNGISIVFNDKAYLITDGRYLTQAANELDKEIFEVIDIATLSNYKWGDNVKNAKLGYDPKLLTTGQLKLFKDFQLLPLTANLVDKIWRNQPMRPQSKAYPYPIEYSGQHYLEKLKSVQDKISLKGAQYCLITASDSLCWLLNIRANDVPFLPIMHGYLLIGLEKTYLFTDLNKVNELESYFAGYVELHSENDVFEFLMNLQGKVLIDESTAPVYFSQLLQERNIESMHVPDPCMLLKACKNDVEIQHIIDGHIKDGAALCEFFAWVDEAIGNGLDLDEFMLDQQLLDFRRDAQGFVFPSFPSIIGFDSNGAIIHYRAQEETAKTIEGNGILLIDSGGQYMGCTTDVTRTIAIGAPTEEQMRRYTQVLKGHLRLSKAKFVKGTTGAHLDTLARFDLWQEGLDYAHGTGHGVGAFLSVHEGPQRISSTSHVPLQPGMVLSNEPGFYKVNEFGIRIENLIYVKPTSNERFLEFATLTLVPYCKVLIDFTMLSREEVGFIDKYYKEIREKIVPLLSPRAKKWLEREISIFL